MATAVDLKVGDPVRTVVGRAVFPVLGLGIMLFGYLWLAKAIPPLYAREPWREDPYDAWISFMFGALPVAVVAGAVRLALCRRDSSLPTRRVVDLLRVCRVLVALIGVTVVTEWAAAVVVRDTYSSRPVFAAFLAPLGLATAAVWWAARRLRAAFRALAGAEVAAQPDWFADVVMLGARELRRFGRAGELARRVLVWSDLVIVSRVRSHPVVAGGVFALGFAAVTDTPQIVLEQYRPGLAAWFVGVSASTMFAFVVLTGRYLSLVPARPGPVAPRYVALVAAAVAVPLAASFRDLLYWSVGTNADDATLGPLVLLTVVWPVVAAVIAYVAAHTRHAIA